jgi:hypothetical protein
MLGEVQEAAPLLEEEVEAILNATTNPESSQGESPEVRFALWLICVVPRLPRANPLELALYPLVRTRSSTKGKAEDCEVPCKDLEEER